MNSRPGRGGGLLAALGPALHLVAAAARLSSGTLLQDACPLLLLSGAAGSAPMPLPL